MNEAQLIAAVDRRLPKDIHRQSMTGVAIPTPDRYYDWFRDLWIEYKCLKHMPRSGTWSVFPLPDVKQQPQGKLTMLQYRWLLRRNTAGGNAVVVVGLPNKRALLLPKPVMWEIEMPIDLARPLEEIAAWIQDFTGG